MTTTPETFEPADHTVEEVTAYLEQPDLPVEEIERVLTAERGGKDRKTVTEWRPKATDVQAVLDARAVAEEQIREHLDGKSVTEGRLRVAIDRHTVAVAAAGGPVDLDWYTRQALARASAVPR